MRWCRAGLAANYPQLLVLRGIGGVGSAIFTIASTSLLLRVANAAQRGQTQSVYRGGFLLGGIIGPAFGGAVIGLSLRAPFFLYAGTLTLAALVALFLLPKHAVQTRPAQVTLGLAEEDSPPTVVVPTAVRTTLKTALANPAYHAALAGNFAVGFSVLGVRSIVVPLLIVQKLDLAAGWIGVVFVVAALVQAVLLLPAGRAVDQIGRKPMLLTGGGVTAIALAALAFVNDVPTLLAATVLFAVGASVLGVAPAAIVGDVVEGKGGTAIAVWQMASDLGSVIGPIGAGALIQHGSFELTLLVSAAVIAACTLPGLRMPSLPRAGVATR